MADGSKAKPLEHVLDNVRKRIVPKLAFVPRNADEFENNKGSKDIKKTPD